MEKNENNFNLKFIPNKVISFKNIKILKKILDNDVFEKYEVIAKVKGEYIICKDSTKLKNNHFKIMRETYKEYIDFIGKRDCEKDTWIYNIIDNIKEQDKILYRDNLCIIIPTYTWNTINIDKLHILSFPIDKTIRCIRELNKDHINLLKYMKNKTIQIIENIYKLKEENLKIFIHYDPSTYHLHIHYVNIIFLDMDSSVEYSHEINNVIFNLSIDTDYYKKIILNKRF